MTRPMRVGLVVPDLSPHDAIGNDVVGMYLILNHEGYECNIYTQTGETRHPFPIFCYADIPLFLDSPDDVLIYHYCVDDPAAMCLLRGFPGRLVLKYHNLTPPRFMARYSKDFALACKRARDGLRHVCQLPLAWVLNDSDFNASDIRPLLPGGVPISTIAPMHRTSELLGSPDDPETRVQLDQAWFNIMTVGRMVPNKALELMIPALGKLRDQGAAGVRLHIAGGKDPRLGSYTALVEALVAEYHLQETVVWHQYVSASKLATLYRHSDVLWTVSQHEGFCVPVVEAMGFGLPVLSSRKGALPETCAGAALFADHNDELVSRLQQLLNDDVLRADLSERGLRRYHDHFRMDRLQEKFIGEFNKIIGDAIIQMPSADADWFGLPCTDELISVATSARVNKRLATADGRRNLVDWIVRVGRRADARAKRLMGSPAMAVYARQLSVPDVAAHLTPSMRLAWYFDPIARSKFLLRTNPEVAAFLEWYDAFAQTDYGDLFGPSIDLNSVFELGDGLVAAADGSVC